ncbi:hypothetical protein PIB30_114153, partial [Stylosanthes scabra]|nr:hypothetical protein [Stylosanthes scabra]
HAGGGEFEWCRAVPKLDVQHCKMQDAQCCRAGCLSCCPLFALMYLFNLGHPMHSFAPSFHLTPFKMILKLIFN